MQALSENALLKLLEEKNHEISKLKTENSILMNIIALIPGNIFWKDTEGKFLGCNNNVAKLFGFKNTNEIIGKTNADFFDAEQVAIADKLDQEICTTFEEKLIEEKGYNIDHEPAIYLSKKAPLFDSKNNLLGILGVSFDITARKKVEEDLKNAKKRAEASSRAKSQFLAVVNHELRTPLTSIVGLLDFLGQKKVAKEEKKNIIAAIDNCTQHLLGLVNEILEFSRLDTGKYHTRYEPVNLNMILQQTYDITNPLAKKKKLTLNLNVPSTMPVMVLADARIILQILINLVSNAIKFTEKGCVTLEVDHRPGLNHMTTYEFKVIDSGLGIPYDKLGLIFEPFQQLEDAYKRQSSRSGTGLGLTIVEKMVELIEAKIDVTSIPGKGSTFTLICELETVASDIAVPTLEVIKKSNQETAASPKKIYPDILVRKPCILLVEDDPIVLYVHRKMLTDLGCEVEAVTHGKQALTTLTHRHDLVFVDISLPDISGFEVIKAIRACAEYSTLPIIALTVYTGREEKIACLKAGANKFASKPISRMSLKKIILHHIQTPRAKPKRVSL